jgi:phosphatidylserine/phosphatidylglycerophosphate/cardiolipin synthase-like enzyme
MHDGYELIATAAARLAGELPFETARIVVGLIESRSDLATAASRMAELPHPHYRKHATGFLTQCQLVAPAFSPSAVALALLAAARCERAHRDEQAVELVWTGPDASVIPIRRTEQAILQVLDSARQRITLVSYAVYKIPNIRDALVRAARRGVRINVVVETPDRNEGENEYSTLRALGDEVAGCSRVFYWPVGKRAVHANGKTAILHVKCVVADGRWLFVSSANLTEYAFTINAELGVLITGGAMPERVEAQFDRLISQSIWQPI